MFLETSRNQKDLLQGQLLDRRSQLHLQVPLTLFSDIFALACSTRSTETSAPLPSFLKCRSPFFLKNSILLSFTSLVSSGSANTPSQCLCSSFCSLFSVFCGILPRRRTTPTTSFFLLSPSWHQTAFNQVIGSGFPRLFLEHSSFDHFFAPCSCFFTYSHIIRFFVLCATLPAASSTSFCFFASFSSCFSACSPQGQQEEGGEDQPDPREDQEPMRAGSQVDGPANEQRESPASSFPKQVLTPMWFSRRSHTSTLHSPWFSHQNLRRLLVKTPHLRMMFLRFLWKSSPYMIHGHGCPQWVICKVVMTHTTVNIADYCWTSADFFGQRQGPLDFRTCPWSHGERF